MDNKYINIKDIAEAKGLTSTRSLRLQINKKNSPYIAREVEVNGGTSYEILYSTLEPEIQELLRSGDKKSTALVIDSVSVNNDYEYDIPLRNKLFEFAQKYAKAISNKVIKTLEKLIIYLLPNICSVSVILLYTRIRHLSSAFYKKYYNFFTVRNKGQ